MYRLRTLGGLTLGRDGEPLDGVGAGRKTLALLALLAAAGERGTSRDRLLALLWPESDTERARGALRQMLHALRRQLGGARAVVGTAELRLDPTVVASDLGEFEGALGRGDLVAAAALYVGPFLDGVHVNDAPEFERWADAERARLGVRAAGALEQLGRAGGRS
jgi:DNA-binding SARP family transcriptional activator